MIRVLVSDKCSPDGVAILEAAKDAVQLDVKTGMTADELKGVIGKYDAIIIRSATKLTKDVLEKATKLKAVARAGVGVDNVDLKYAKERGIAVMNTPGGSTSAVAELALGMMLALARRLCYADATMKAGKWEKKTLEGAQLNGKTLGIVGLGRIGRKLGDYARALGMKTVGYDPLVTGAVEGVTKVSLDELYAQSDYISLHIPLTPETKHIIGEASIAKMKKGVRIINCARGGVIDEAALGRALDSGHVAGAGLDVFEAEPPAAENVGRHPGVVATPHIGAATAEAQASVSSEAAEIIVHFARTGVAQNRVA
jgi:D-3-phosphoglycerate dehydrogenase